jgi:hypothetical protein
MDLNLRSEHFSGNSLGTPSFPRELSFFPLINCPMLLFCYLCSSFFSFLRQEPRMATLSLATTYTSAVEWRLSVLPEPPISLLNARHDWGKV